MRGRNTIKEDQVYISSSKAGQVADNKTKEHKRTKQQGTRDVMKNGKRVGRATREKIQRVFNSFCKSRGNSKKEREL